MDDFWQSRGYYGLPHDVSGVIIAGTPLDPYDIPNALVTGKNVMAVNAGDKYGTCIRNKVEWNELKHFMGERLKDHPFMDVVYSGDIRRKVGKELVLSPEVQFMLLKQIVTIRDYLQKCGFRAGYTNPFDNMDWGFVTRPADRVADAGNAALTREAMRAAAAQVPVRNAMVDDAGMVRQERTAEQMRAYREFIANTNNDFWDPHPTAVTFHHGNDEE
jgi:hypothetical protein